jgi:hypothetical protein
LAAAGAFASQSSMHSVDSSGSLFSQTSSASQSQSVWMDSGLPGLDLGASSNFPGVPVGLQMLWGGGGRAATPSSGTAAPPKAPPPGFGSHVYAGSTGSGLANGTSSIGFGEGSGLVGAGGLGGVRGEVGRLGGAGRELGGDVVTPAELAGFRESSPGLGRPPPGFHSPLMAHLQAAGVGGSQGDALLGHNSTTGGVLEQQQLYRPWS